MYLNHLKAFAIGTLVTAQAGTAVLAQDMAQLPDQITVVTYDTGTSGYNVTMAMTGPFKENLGANLRILPGKNDVARVSLLQNGTANFAALGSEAVYTQEGMYVFGQPNLGPQQVRLVAMNINRGSSAMLTAADANIRTVEDLRGKTVALIKGSPVSKNFTAAYLAFGGLTWDDVEAVEVASFSDANSAILDGRVDAMVSNTNSSIGQQLEASPRGTYYIPFPHEDSDGWERMNSIIPWLYRHTATTGPTIPETGVEMGTSPYPMLVARAEADEDLVYNMTKAIFEMYPEYKDAVIGAEGWSVDIQKVEETFVPYHEGAVRYFKEIGIWTDNADANNQENVLRQQMLADAWADYLASGPSSDVDAFQAGWQEKRAGVLEAANLPLIDRNW